MSEENNSIQTHEQALSSLRAKINDAIHQIECLFHVHDALELIAPLAINTQFASIGEQSEPKPQMESPYTLAVLEYALSLATAIPYPTTPQPITEAIINQLIELLEFIHNQLHAYYLLDALGDRPNGNIYQNKRQLHMRIWSVSVRGAGYKPFADEVYREIFAPLEDWMSQKLGFRPSDLIQFSDRVVDALERRVEQDVMHSILPLAALHQRFVSWAASRPLPLDRGFAFREFMATDEVARDFDMKTAASHLARMGGKSTFQVVAQNDTEQRIIDVLALDVGTNGTFLPANEWRGWPLGNTLVRERPLTRIGSDVYAMSIQSLANSHRLVTEAAVRRTDAPTYERNYCQARDKYLESKVASLFAAWFSKGNTATALHYDFNDDGIMKWCELDCLVQFGDTLLLIEAKAGSMNPAARRGAAKTLDSDLKDLVGKAHQQAYRAWRYIDASATAPFFDARRREVTKVNKQRYRRAFLINVTLDDLAPIAPNVSSMNVARIDGCPWLFWSVSLLDLMTIKEVLRSPTVFLHYLHRREATLKGPLAEAADELDFLMFYVRQGLYTQEMNVEFLSLDTFTDELDDYFLRKSKGFDAPHPSPQMPPGLHRLIDAIDAHPRANGPSAVLALLDGDAETREKAAEMLAHVESLYEQDGQSHNAVMQIRDYVIVLICGRLLPSNEEARLRARKWLSRGVNIVYTIVWAYPIGNGELHTRRFDRTNS